jgi:hypothetical protein
MQQDQTIVEAVNRTTEPLSYMFDGVPGVIVPGYKIMAGKVVPAGRDGQPQTTAVGKTRAEYARRQNVKMGSEDATTGEATFLIGVAERDEMGKITADPHWLWNEISYTEKGTAIERFDRTTLDEAAQGASAMRTSGYPRGRQGAADAPFQYADGPVTTQRTD